MTGLGIAACDARFCTLAPQHPGSDRVAVRQYLIRAEGGVARADELGLARQARARSLARSRTRSRRAEGVATSRGR